MDDLMTQAVAQYPYLANKNIAYVNTYDPTDTRMLESWPAGESGDKQYPRPAQIPIDQFGIQNISSKTRPIDVLGDYVSHDAVNKDPYLQRAYQAFEQSLPPTLLKKRYEYAVKKEGERRPYDEWKTASGLPEYFRGYTFDQWPDAKQMYGKEQIQILDQIKQYLGIK